MLRESKIEYKRIAYNVSKVILILALIAVVINNLPKDSGFLIEKYTTFLFDLHFKLLGRGVERTASVHCLKNLQATATEQNLALVGLEPYLRSDLHQTNEP